jgi:hypothetical protein
VGTPGGSSGTTTILSVPHVLAVTGHGGATTTSILPVQGGGSVVSVTVGCPTVLGISVGQLALGCSPTSTAQPTTVIGAVSSLVSTTLQAVTGLVGALLGTGTTSASSAQATTTTTAPPATSKLTLPKLLP